MIIRRRTIHFLVPFHFKLLQELGLLLVLVAVAILTYSSLAYFAEREAQVGNCTHFPFFAWRVLKLFLLLGDFTLCFQQELHSRTM